MSRSEPTTRKGRATRDRIVHATVTLIRERGVAAITLDDVQAASDVGRSQLYHYFDDRDDLIRAVVDATIDAVLGSSVDHLGSLDSFEEIDRWFDTIEQACSATNGVGGCPIGSLVGQLAEFDDVARCSLADAFERWMAPLSQGLGRLQQHGVLRADVDTDELADFTMAALQGGLLLAQVWRDPARLRHALDGARRALRAAAA